MICFIFFSFPQLEVVKVHDALSEHDFCQKFDQYIRLLYPGRFILIESVENDVDIHDVHLRLPLDF